MVPRLHHPLLDQLAVTEVCFDNTDFFDARYIYTFENLGPVTAREQGRY